MDRLSRGLSTIGACALVAGATYVCTARAGATSTVPVAVSLSARSATGSFGSTRNSTTNGNSYLFCQVTGTTTALSAGCAAYDGTSGASCATSNPILIAALQKLPPDANVTFYWDASGTCTNVNVAFESRTEPKRP